MSERLVEIPGSERTRGTLQAGGNPCLTQRLFLFLGLLLCAWGVGFGAYHWILSVMTNHVASTGTVMLAVLPLILGFQLILEAIVIDIQATPK